MAKAWWEKAWDAVTGNWGDLATDAALGAGTGLVLHHLTGGKGEDNLTALGLGAGAGAALNYFGSDYAPSRLISGWTGGGGGGAPGIGDTASASAGRQNVPSFTSGEVSSAVAPTTVSAAAPTSFGSMGSPNFDTMSGSEFEKYASGGGGSTLESVFNTAKDSVGKVQQFGKDYAAPIDLGLKGMKLLGDRAASEQQANALRDYAARSEASTAAQNARSDELGNQIRSTNDVGNETRRAYAGTMARANAQAAGLKKTIMANGGSAATAEAKARQARIAGSMGAVSAGTTAGQTAGKNMVAGLSSLKYSDPSVSAADARSIAAGIDTTRSNDLYEFGQDVFGTPSRTAGQKRGLANASGEKRIEPDIGGQV